MNRPLVTPDWQQSYPTYELGHPEIALAEYQAASERTRDDDNAISIANGILLVAIAPIIPIISPYLVDTLTTPALLADRFLNFGIFTVATAFVTLAVAAYFCQLRRSYVHSARKVIVLRKMMGQSYGPITMVLPNWRLEGADNAFSIRMFPGWSMQVGYPYYMLAALGASIFAYGFSLSAPFILQGWAPIITLRSSTSLWAVFAVWLAWFFATLYYMRTNLFDHHERSNFIFARVLAKILRVKLKEGSQTILYGARLSRFEAERIGLDLREARKFAVIREDREYMHHGGVSLKATARAAYKWISGNGTGGGSTITQQLSRTLFIIDLNKVFRRKIIEILLARWLNGLLSKTELLDIYLCSVRYDKGIYGIAAALHHFFGPKGKLDIATSILLVERISNISGTFRREAVALMLERLIRSGSISRVDALKVLAKYRALLRTGKILPGKNGSPSDIAKEFSAEFAAYR